jgi:predicted CXXCH cytochrome family protein
MKNFLKSGWLALSSLKTRLILSSLLSVSFAFVAPVALAADVELDAPELACLKCHDKDGLKMKTQKGEVLPLSISTKAFIDSMHNKTSCEDCHDDLDEKEHGKKPSTVSSKREFTLKMSDTCVSCHKENVALFKDTVHAAMINGGSDKAASCSDCHNSHTVKSVKILSPIDQVPCARCHEDIYKAYSKDVHGLERIAKGKDSPTCNTCHSAHEIKAASFGDALKDSCIKCHKDSASSHEKWLPNSALHFEAVSCPVCHAPDAQRRVNLRMVDSIGGKQLLEQRGVPKFERLIKTADGKEVGLDEKELRSFLKEFNLESEGPKAILSGRLEVRSGVQAHQLSEKSKAIKDCKVCHQYGATPFQTVVLTIAGPDGRPMRHGVEKEILSSLTATGTMKGFYAIGSTRIKLLDYLLVLVLLGVACVPIAHLTANRLFKAKREQLKAASNKDQS